MNKQLLLWSIVIALGGFLFGFDTAVISGAEQKIKEIWQLSDWSHGLAIGVALYGTILGAIFGGNPAQKWGRRNTLIAIGALYLISALGSALALGVNAFMFYRFIGGLAIGASSVVSPMYISEIAPANNRGKLVAIFQFNIVFGIVIAYLSNYLLQDIASDNSWRWMLGVEALPAALFFVFMFLVPESPRWLILKKGNYSSATAILKTTDPIGADVTLKLLQEEQHQDLPKKTLRSFFSKRFKAPIFLAFFIAAFNQLSGINAILYFAPRIFEMAGIEKSAAFLQSVGIGLVNIVFTLLGLYLIDKLGRKTLMIVGSVGYVFALSGVALCFSLEVGGGFWVPFFLFAFIAAHAVGQGAVIWVFISEIFPNSVRAYGQSFGAATHWILAAVIATVFPVIASNIGAAPIFKFFATMMVVQFLWVIIYMPETKGVELEKMEEVIND